MKRARRPRQLLHLIPDVPKAGVVAYQQAPPTAARARHGRAGKSRPDPIRNMADRFLAIIQSGNWGKWQKPWQAVLAAQGLTRNPVTGNTYTGANAIAGMVETAAHGYPTNEWATYRQWASIGAQVHKGEKSVGMIRWGISHRCLTCDKRTGEKPCPEKGHETTKRLWARGFRVFNAAQVDGYEPTPVPAPELPNGATEIASADSFAAATGADIRHVAGDRACFSPHTDHITLPLRDQFTSTAGYYGTLFHELVHWSGGRKRLNRPFGRRFGDKKYAREELVAELGSTFLAADLRVPVGVPVEPDAQTAAYLGSWLGVVANDPQVFYRACRDAEKAVSYLRESAKQVGGGSSV